MNSMSVLDTIAHALFVLYSPHEAKSDIYIGTARAMIGKSHSGSQVEKVLDAQLKPGGWFTEFERYRHCTTHESLIVYDDIHFSVDKWNYALRLGEPIRLPDNPQVRPLTYELNRNVVDYCLLTFQRIESLIFDIYDSALLDIRAKGDILPVP